MSTPIPPEPIRLQQLLKFFANGETCSTVSAADCCARFPPLTPTNQRTIRTFGWTEARLQIGAQWYLAEALSLLLGVGLFVGRIPERLSPGSFDIWGHSHQLFHTSAVVGTAFHLVALIVGFQYRQTHLYC